MHQRLNVISLQVRVRYALVYGACVLLDGKGSLPAYKHTIRIRAAARLYTSLLECIRGSLSLGLLDVRVWGALDSKGLLLAHTHTHIFSLNLRKRLSPGSTQ